MLLTWTVATICAGWLAAPVAFHEWTPGTAPEGENAPAVERFRDGWALRFVRERQTSVDLGQGEDGALRLSGALTLAAVVQLEAEPPTKVALISKWRTAAGGRSYELGVTPQRRLYFTISASGSWDARARQLLSTRPLRVGVPYGVAAMYSPGERMALFVNGVPSGELTLGVPASVYDSPTPVLLGNRDGGEASCGFEGLLGPVCIHGAALDDEAVAAWTREVGLTAPPEPELPRLEPPYDLEALKQKVREWYRGLQAPGEQYGAYRLTPTRPPDMYASADVAWIRWMMDDLGLTQQERRQRVDFIQDQQNPDDGSYRHITGHCATHAFCHATGALNMLGAAQRHRPNLLEPYLDVGRVGSWLDGINWVRQWGASHDIWGAGLPLVCSPATPAEWTEAVFAWLDAQMDPQTGFWRRGVSCPRPMEYLGGAFHIWPLYAALERPLPYPERVIDSVLRLQEANGAFGGGFDYGNMDGVWVLQYLAQRRPYRREDVLAALERNAHGLMRLYNDEPSRFLGSAHSTESRIATLAILQAALPELFTAERPWRNPWHRRELFVIRCEGQ